MKEPSPVFLKRFNAELVTTKYTTENHHEVKRMTLCHMPTSIKIEVQAPFGDTNIHQAKLKLFEMVNNNAEKRTRFDTKTARNDYP